MNDALFLDGSSESGTAALHAITTAARLLTDWAAEHPEPVPAVDTDEVVHRLNRWEICPSGGADLDGALRDVASWLLPASVNVSSPGYLAHLLCPPTLPAIAAAVLEAGLNQSMDSFDQAPAASHVEDHLVRWLCAELGLPDGAGGVFTPGATQSNLMGLLAARQRSGSQDGAVVVCSDSAHFAVARAADLLGLGDRVVVVPTSAGPLTAARLGVELQRLQRKGIPVMAVSLTAGTTDTGVIDDLAGCADVARAAGAWVHVDAAAGGALAFSPRHRHLVAGIAAADSVSMDGHKLLFQPVSSGVFLCRSAVSLTKHAVHAAYLNPEEDEDAGVLNLADRSLQTTRPFDAIKLLVTLRVLGRERLGGLIGGLVDAAAALGQEIQWRPGIELVRPPVTNTVVFRVLPPENRDGMDSDADSDGLQRAVREHLWHSRRWAVGRCRIDGRAALKVTVMNPAFSPEAARELLDDLEAARLEAVVSL
jgi:L-2,4-diaminobutyrate decarboxylase